jgi:YD repeat-containing protein
MSVRQSAFAAGQTVARNFGRALGLMLVISLLASSSPTAGPSLVSFAKDAEQTAVLRLRNSAVLSGLRSGLAFGSSRYWHLADKFALKTKSEKGPQLAAIAAAINPAPPVIDAPTNMTVTATANTSISLSWTAPAGTVSNYQVERSQSPSGPFSVIGTPTVTSFNDTTVGSGNAYLYRVRAVSGGISSPSNMAVGTAITYTDNPLSAGVTTVKAVHITELRQSVNAVRSVAGLSAASWTDTSPAGITIKAVHVQEMRDKLGEALAALSVSATAYTDPVLATGASGTLVKQVHIEELRLRATRGVSSSSGSFFEDSSVARLDPLNRIGSEDPLSRNFNWNLPLVRLPGRAGLDLGLALSYNSLATWTKSGLNISFDDDHGFPAPGFRLGFPIIQAAFYNSQAAKYSFLMITPSGTRVELRQVGTSNLYQSVDSSYLLLDSNTMILKTAEGTQMSYAWLGSDFQCTQVKDRNGNFITIAYDAFSRLDKITDTLAREVKFTYNGTDLVSITQTWTVNGQQQPTYTWATFTYANQIIQTNFSGLTVNGPQNGNTIRALTRVTLADNSHFDFDYTSWGQMWRIRNFATATNDHLLNYRSYNLPVDNSAAQTDCPRFTQRRDWAANWNRNQSGIEQEAVTTYTVPTSSSWTLPGGTPQTGMVAQVTQPDSTYHKIYFAGTAGTSTGWQRSLTSLVETYDSADVRQRQSVSTWTQDDPGFASLLNPRVTETNIYDPSGNRARTRLDYASFNLADGTTCRYPQDIYDYAANATSVLRRTHVDYQMTSAYTDRRVLGLPSAKYLCDGAQGEVPCNDSSGASLLSKITFQYDETGAVQGNDAPVQHDNTNYTASFVIGRGNLSSTRRYDVINIGQFTTTTSQYNTAGASVKSIDAAGHQTQMSYADAFAANGTTLDSGLPSTLAYPTTVTDPDGYTATTRYNYQFGAVTWKRTPQPNTTQNLPGPEQKITYDSIGRTERITNLVNNAYSRFIYGPNYVETFSTVNNVADEAHSLQVVDGHGRTIGQAANHPGSVGGFSGQLTIYDVMARVVKRSNPTETAVTISGAPIQPYNWAAAGDDAQAGWVYTLQTYDWKGRPLVTTNPSTTGNPAETTTRSASYTGCGCAGGEVVTLTDEMNRQQKVYSDVFGRAWKTEIWTWPDANNNRSVYATTVTVYDARDQVKIVNQYVGSAPLDASSTNENVSCPGGTCQKTTTTYDGYGRLQSKHAPEQNTGTVTAWTYNPDDTVHSITDARGASATYTYNNGRHLVNLVEYGVPTGTAATPNISFGYDAVGNRTSMTDGGGSTSYVYDQLSRMSSETRIMNGLSGSFTIGYSYNLTGQLKTLTDPDGRIVNYDYDNSDRLTNVTGTGYNHSELATNFQYRAWGALKHYNIGFNWWNGTASQTPADFSYNNRLQLTYFKLTHPTTGAGAIYESAYEYSADGLVKFISDKRAWSMQEGWPPTENMHHFDRGYIYDHAARLTQALTGDEARGGTNADGPYKETYQYDAWHHMTQRVNRIWSKPLDSFIHTYVNNRIQEWPAQYDAEGNDVSEGSFDAASRKATFDTYLFLSLGSVGLPLWYSALASVTYDGDGQMVKEEDKIGPTTYMTLYFVRSTVLDGKEILMIKDEPFNGQGVVTRMVSIYANGETIARSTNGTITFEHSEPLTGRRSGVEVDPFGQEVGSFDPGPEEPGDVGQYPEPHEFGNVEDPSRGCTLDGITIDCATLARFTNPLSPRWTSLFLPPGWHPQIPRSTPPTFPSPQPPIRVSQVLSEVFAGTPVGTIFFPQASDLWRFINPTFFSPQKAPGTTVWQPIGGVEKLRELLVRTLAFGNCRDKLRLLFKQIADDTGFPASHTDVLDLFDALRKQTGGGGILVDLQSKDLNDHLPEAGKLKQQPAGGGGLSSYFYVNGKRQRWSAVWLRGAYSDSQKLAFDRIPYFYALTLIHELAHNAPSDDSRLGRVYEHEEMDAAAIKLGSVSFDQYVRDHCIPKKYW